MIDEWELLPRRAASGSVTVPSLSPRFLDPPFAEPPASPLRLPALLVPLDVEGAPFPKESLRSVLSAVVLVGPPDMLRVRVLHVFEDDLPRFEFVSEGTRLRTPLWSIPLAPDGSMGSEMEDNFPEPELSGYVVGLKGEYFRVGDLE